jgi:hypothetical protein
MCLACEQEALYFAYLKQVAERTGSQEGAVANQSAFSAEPAAERASSEAKAGAGEPR